MHCPNIVFLVEHLSPSLVSHTFSSFFFASFFFRFDCDLYAMLFENIVILITGANGSIGSACAEYFAKQGALLALVGRNEKKFEKIVKKIKGIGANMNEPLVIIADVSIDAERIINETIEKYNRLDILINNAGFSIPGSIETLKMDDYDAMMVRTFISLRVHNIIVSFLDGFFLTLFPLF